MPDTAPAVFDRMCERIEASGALFYRLAFWQDGRTAACDFRPMSACANLYSVSKCVTATAVGLAADRGLLRLDDPIVRLLGDWVPPDIAPMLERAAVRDLLTQTSGIRAGSMFETDRYLDPGDDWVGRVLRREAPYEPGTTFVYDNGNYYLLSCIVERVTGRPLDVFLKETLFRELGIRELAWERCPREHVMGATGCYMRADDVLKLGLLYLQEREWESRRLLSREWTRAAVTAFPATGAERYGFSFRCKENGDAFVPGAHNQMLYLSPACRAVVAVQGFDETFPLDAMLDEALRS